MSRFGLGETVGEAFIRIHASGSNLPEEIRREFKKADPVIEGEGRHHAKTYGEAWEREMESPTTRDKLRGSITDALAEAALKKTFFESGNWKEFQTSMRTEFREVGDRASANLQRGLAQGGSFAEFETRLRNINREVVRATEEITAEEKRQADERDRQTEKMLANLRRQATALEAAKRQRLADLRVLGREGDSVIRDLNRAAAARNRLFGKSDTGFAAKDFETMRKDIDEVSRMFNLVRGDSDAARAHIDKMRESLIRIRTDTDRVERGFAVVDRRVANGVRDVGDFERKLTDVVKRVERLDLGRVFGKGARNNFFNIMGRLIGSVLDFTLLIGVRATRSVIRFFSVLNQQPGVLGKLNFLFNSLGSGLLKLAGAAGAAFLALGALLEFIAGPLVAAVADLGGVITALAATIGIGLVGALAALLPLLGVLGAGLGVVVLAFVKLSKAQKAALKLQLKPVIADLNEMRKVARQGLFSNLDTQVPLLHKFMEQSAIPIVRAAAKSMSDSITGFLKVLTGPVARRNLDVLRKLIPDAGRALGKIFGNLFNIIGGFLRAATPLTRKFLDSLVDATGKVSKLVNSAKGQNNLKAWLDGAWDSAKKLWKTVKDLVQIIFIVLNAAKPTGDTFFDTINKSLDQFIKFLNSSRGKRALADWMGQSKTFATNLGKAVDGIVALFNALNNQTSQGILNALLQGLGLLGKGLADVIPPFDQFIKIVTPTVVGIFKGLFSVVKNLFVFLDHHTTTAKIVAGSLAILFATLKAIALFQFVGGALTTITTFFAGLTTAVTSGFSTFLFAMRTGTLAALTAREKLNAALTGIGILVGANLIGNQIGGPGGKAVGIAGGIIGGALFGGTVSGGNPLGFAIGGILGGAASAVEQFWHRTNDSSDEAKKIQVANLQAIQAEADNLAFSLEQDANRIGKLTRLQVATSLSRIPQGKTISPLVAAQRLGISGTTLVGAITKGGPAFVAVNSQLERMLGLGDRLEAQGHRLETRARLAPGLSAAQRGALFNRAGTLFQQAAAARALLPDIQEVLAALGGEHTSLRQSIRTTDERMAAARQLNLATRNLATQTFAYTRVLNGNSESAKRNRQFIRDHVRAIDASSGANVKNAKAARDAANSIISQTDAFRRQLIQAHFNKTTVDALIRTYGHIPKSILTKLQADDSDAARKIAITLFKKGLITKQWLIKIVGKDEATPVIAGVKRHLDALHDKTITVRVQSASGRAPAVPLASGGLFLGATPAVVGEAGLEAVVPLNRPLDQIDPSVRWLAAYAQGLQNNTKNKADGTVIAQRVTNIQPGAIIVTTPTTDPRAVAVETMNRLVARGGYG